MKYVVVFGLSLLLSFTAYGEDTWVRDAQGNITNIRFDGEPSLDKTPVQNPYTTKELKKETLKPITPTKQKIWKWVDQRGRVHFSDKKKNTSAHEFKAKHSLSVIGFHNQKNKDNTYRIAFTKMGENMLVKGEVNGVSLNFILDTGASLVIIPPSVASRADVVVDLDQRIILQTVNGQINAPKVMLAELKLGFLAQDDVEAAVQNIGIANTGLLGMSFLKNYNMNIDSKHQELVLEKK